MFELSLILLFVSVVALVLVGLPPLLNRAEKSAKENTAKFVVKYEAVLNEEQLKTMRMWMVAMPAVSLGAAILFAPPDMKIIAVIAGVAVGLMLPRMRLKMLIQKRKSIFDDQLTDVLMIMSSSFRGGLSLIQAIESVVDEMPEPTKQEFGIVLGENKMGVPLDDSLARLYKRMPSPSMQQMVTAILLARETGGNLAVIFSRIVASKRERKKIEQNLKTLTIQGKIQAVVMTGLPVAFFTMVSASNPRFFDVMKNTPDGQRMLAVCVVLWILGALSIWKISTFKDV